MAWFVVDSKGFTADGPYESDHDCDRAAMELTEETDERHKTVWREPEEVSKEGP